MSCKMFNDYCDIDRLLHGARAKVVLMIVTNLISRAHQDPKLKKQGFGGPSEPPTWNMWLRIVRGLNNVR